MMGKLLDEAVALCDRLADAMKAEANRLYRWEHENERGGNYLRKDRIRRALVRAGKREDRRRRKFFPA